MTTEILGTEYRVELGDLNDPEFADADGLCKQYDKVIKLRKLPYMLETAGTMSKKQRFYDCLRHELIHAFCAESGVSYDDDEMLVDWIAKTIPKLESVFTSIKEELVELGEI